MRRGVVWRGMEWRSMIVDGDLLGWLVTTLHSRPRSSLFLIPSHLCLCGDLLSDYVRDGIAPTVTRHGARRSRIPCTVWMFVHGARV